MRIHSDSSLTGLGDAPIYTMRDLNQHTAEVIQQVNESGRPAAITRHGRFVALLTPLANANVESAMIDALLEETETTDDSQVGAIYSAEEAADRLRG